MDQYRPPAPFMYIYKVRIGETTAHSSSPAADACSAHEHMASCTPFTQFDLSFQMKRWSIQDPPLLHIPHSRVVSNKTIVNPLFVLPFTCRFKRNDHQPSPFPRHFQSVSFLLMSSPISFASHCVVPNKMTLKLTVSLFHYCFIFVD